MLYTWVQSLQTSLELFIFSIPPALLYVGGVHNIFWLHSRQISFNASNVLARVRKYGRRFFFEFPCETILIGTSVSLRNRYCTIVMGSHLPFRSEEQESIITCVCGVYALCDRKCVFGVVVVLLYAEIPPCWKQRT